ncbi:MAG: hypothetical protein HOV80_19310 [Polyangiaceae bacterium]|nr:hypothetical protein [Polyangiaceae bacterium]
MTLHFVDMAPSFRSGRRLFLRAGLAVGGAAACAHAERAFASAPSFEVRALTVKGKHASRANLLVPTHLGKDEKVRLLVALHGLGESGDPALGIRAWLDLYGLRTSYERLRTPPIERTSKRKDWTDERLAEVNQSLKKKAFAGIAVLCPFTPNIRKMQDSASAQRDYGEWITNELVPAARKEAPVLTTAAATSIDGCSMGGPIALETYLAHPTAYGALGMVQSALNAARAAAWATALAKAREKNEKLALHLLSSAGDPFAEANRALSKELKKRDIPHTMRISPGPHDQPWLRETGTIEMLLFHERGR